MPQTFQQLDRDYQECKQRVAKLTALLSKAQQFTGDYVDHAETWEMCAVAELDADMCEALNAPRP